MSPTLVLLRHGETPYNSEKDRERVRGWINVPLNETGRKEAEKIAKRLEQVKASFIVSSDLDRAFETAKIIQLAMEKNQKRKIKLVKNHHLRPWNMGTLQGETVSTVRKTMLQHQIMNKSTAPPNGEPFNAFLQRFLSFFRTLLRLAKRDGPIVAITHTRGLRTADAWFYAGCPDTNRIDSKILTAEQHLKTGEGLIFHWNGTAWDRYVLKPESQKHANQGS